MHNHTVDDEHPSARGQLVLLVEDERSIAEPFAEALRRSGFRAIVASTGHDAIAQAASCRPDVILLDLALPDLDGRDVCQSAQDLRIDPASRRVWESLMSDVWDVNRFGSTKTLDVHIGWLRRKLDRGAGDRGYVRTVRGVGFCLIRDPREAP